MTAEQRKIRHLNVQIKNTLYLGYLALNTLGQEMIRPSNYERGRNIAKATNALYVAFDSLAHFGLGYSFKKIAKMKKS